MAVGSGTFEGPVNSARTEMQSPIRPMSAGYVSGVPCGSSGPCGSRGQCKAPAPAPAMHAACGSVQQCAGQPLSGRPTSASCSQQSLWQQPSSANLRRRPQAAPPQVHQPAAADSAARVADHLASSRSDHVPESVSISAAGLGSFIPPTPLPATPNLQSAPAAPRSGGSVNGTYLMPACAGTASPPRQHPSMPLQTLTSLTPSVDGSASGLVTLEQLPSESLAHAASVNFPQNRDAAQVRASELISPGRPISTHRPTRTSITKSPTGLPTTTQAAQSLKLFAFGGVLPNADTVPLDHYIPSQPDAPVSVVSAADLSATGTQVSRQHSAGSPDGHGGRRCPASEPLAASQSALYSANASVGPATPVGTMPLTPRTREPLQSEEVVRGDDENLDTTREVPRVMQQIQWKVAQAMGETASRQVIASAVKVQIEDANKQARVPSTEASTCVSSEGQVAESQSGTEGDPVATPALSVQALEPAVSAPASPGESTLFAIASSACRSSISDSVVTPEPLQLASQAAVQEHILQQQQALTAMQAMLRVMKAERADRESSLHAALQQVRQQMDAGLSKAQTAVAAWPNRHELMVKSVHGLQNQISDLNSIAGPLSGEAGIVSQVQGLTAERQRVLDTLTSMRTEQETFRMMLNEQHNDIAQLSDALSSLPGSNGTGGATVEDMEELHILREEVMVVTTSVKELCTRVDELSENQGLETFRMELGTLTGIVSELSKKVDGLTIASVPVGGKAVDRQLGQRAASQSSASSLDGVTATAQALRERLSKLLGDVQRGESQAGSVANEQ